MKNKLTALIGTVALMAAMLPVNVTAYWTDGYEVLLNGNSIGIVEYENEVSSMLAVVNYQLVSAYDEEAVIEPEIQLRAKLVSSEKLLDKNTLHDEIASVSDKMVEAVRITVDGAESVAVSDMETAESAVNMVIDSYTVEGSKAVVVELVGFVDQMVPEAEIRTAEEAAEHIITEKLITVSSEVAEEDIKEFTPEPTEYEDENVYAGVRVTTDKGTAGQIKVVTVKSYVNGELMATATEETVIDEGVPAKIAIGTKPRPSGIGTGSFIMPTKGRLTSSYGRRWGRMHNGLDIAAAAGTPIYASDDGVVICAEYSNSFGNLIKIDHGNGFETYYAHNSEILVSYNEPVKKGQIIAQMGSTGRSTGPHCHFEIHYNGQVQNPMDYLK
ncbi:MAG: peptidoglycan DD-metalloendopeptidase family protein [Eubacteriales bacterium]|nr:peptidoglycan DD-metalloendopeptidase family protein [Eubacteriales bacterium]